MLLSDCLLNNTTEIVSDWLRPGPLLGYGLVNKGIKGGPPEYCIGNECAVD
jgi:hypothetical protein